MRISAGECWGAEEQVLRIKRFQSNDLFVAV